MKHYKHDTRDRLLLAAATVLVLLTVAGRFVLADRVVARARRFKACVLFVPPPNDPSGLNSPQTAASNPWIFYVLNNRTDIKPDGWSFYNPAAAGAVTQAQVARWDAIGGGPGKSGLVAGQRLRPN